ncbi:MAG: hypothetical protein LBG07_00315 [Treponema sp.]|nr:hypothetical protein [Treponema sp.]
MKELRDRAIRAGWIAGLLLAGWFLWFFTASPRENSLKHQVNLILNSRGEDFRLGDPLRRGRALIPLGTEFSLESPAPDPGGEGGSRSFLVFPLVSGGSVLSCGVLIDSQGKVERFIPLGAHGEQAFERIPRGILDVYIRRVEGEEKP